MVIYDSVKKNKVEFKPIKQNEVSLYVCGATVYDNAHLGHARSALTFDILVRTLRELGYKVIYCKNITDIDDKIIAKVKKTNKTLKELTEYYIDRYNQDMESLGVIRADIEPKATDSIDAIIAMINNLISKGFAYIVDNGDIYFDTSKDNKYGLISHQVVDDKLTQNRVDNSDSKRNLKDFVLWKGCKDNQDICYDSNFGKGRPGWHIECSAMIEKHFIGDKNYTIDIHGGGADLLFPHHENEATQSRCSNGKELSKYWIHNGFVNIDGTKMSKSLGNSFFIKDALKSYNGEILRYYLISTHYRNDFNFNEEDLLASKKRLDKLYRLKKRLPTKGSAVNREFKNNLLSAMSDDLNISKALSIIDEMVNNANDTLDKEPKNRRLKKEIISNIEFINTLLGFGGKEPYSYFQMGIDKDTKAKIEDLISKRNKAKKDKNFKLSDTIRDELNAMGVSIMDSPDGTFWEI
jgi:cysteinyl-tRNA synthetase